MAATQTRIYRATIGENDRLVRASHPSHVATHIARDLIRVRVASQSDLVECIGDGIPIEDIGPEQQELPDA